MTKADCDFEVLPIGLGPDGRSHLMTRADPQRAFCGWREMHRVPESKRLYTVVSKFSSMQDHCRDCAIILSRRARFPQFGDDELKPLLERIRKLYALASNNPNENEAAAAMAMANDLIERHNLAKHVAADAVELSVEKGITESIGINVARYKHILAGATADLFGSTWYLDLHGEYREWRYLYEKRVVFVGLPANVAAALVTYPYLCAAADACYRAARRRNASTVNARDYKDGFAVRIRERVAAEKRKVADPELTALLRLENQVAERAMEIERLFFGRGKEHRCNLIRDLEAFRCGYQDGDRVDLYGARTSRMLDEA
jgi:hypothetical protein